VWYARIKSKLCDKVKLYTARASGSANGLDPTKSRGAGVVNPCENFIPWACSQPAGNCRFTSTPVELGNLQPKQK